MSERTMHQAVKDLLLAGTPYQYCHLVKFERPSLPDSVTGKLSTSKERYSYIADSSIDVTFDDGSESLLGVPNGPQVYIANKLLSIGNITEETEAKASTVNIDLDGTSIGSNVSAVVDTKVVSTGVYDIVFPSDVDLIYEGFREGDKVYISGISAPGDYKITGFRYGNTVRLEKVDTTLVAETDVSITMTISSDEIISVLSDKNSSVYASFLNRYVSIWKAFFVDGELVGEPLLRFRGIISSVGFDDSDSMIKVSWGLTSHWGDWAQVSGRLTSDDFHRALDSTGNPNPLSAIKPLYAYDKGFIHAETSLTLLAKYNVQVQQQKVTSSSGFLGLFSKVSVRKYMATEERSTELDFQLTSKYIPVVYGVRKVQGIPVFVDTLNDDSSVVYTAYALCEGEINSIYDVYVEGNSLICGNKSDYDARSVQTDDNTVQLVCRGRADRGDVLGGDPGAGTVPQFFYDGENYLFDFGYNLLEEFEYFDYVVPASAAAVTQSGVLDSETLVLTSPQEIAIDFFSGKAGQKAAPSLVNIAAEENFKIQNDYWSGTDTAEYWGPNHRLLDTAYVVTKTVIKDGETTTPSLDFIVKGKVIPCYNYDYSYSQWSKASGESEANFVLGATVTFFDAMMNPLTPSSGQIIDKFFVVNPDGTVSHRFRFDVTPGLGYVDGVPSATKFVMKSGSNTWTMITYNHVEHSGVPAAQLSSVITAVTNNSGKLGFTFNSNSNIGYDIWSTANINKPIYSIHDSTTLATIDNEIFGFSIVYAISQPTNTDIITEMSYDTLASYAAGADNETLVARNCIKLDASANSTNGYYDGYRIILTKTDSSTGTQVVQEKTILQYFGATRIAIIDGIWDEGAIPGTTGYTYSLVQAYADHRTSTNFALITADYISSERYGKRLTIGEDLNFNSILESARLCDERSDVTVRCTSAPTVSVGDVYKYPSTGNILWQGTVLETFSSTVPGSTTHYVTFTNVIGKLTKEWNSWNSFLPNELVYVDGLLYSSSGGITADKPSHTSGTTGLLTWLGSLSLTRVTGTGSPTIPLFYQGNPVQSVLNGRISSGYSLYDSDGIDYWKYVGWESKDQRWVTKHQGNITIDTSQTLFDNTNSLLALFGGILRFNGGQHYLEVETIADAIEDGDPAIITEEHIIGRIKLQDEGVRGSYNSLSVSYADPSNKFEARSISFFNSDFLKEDRNVPRKGSLSLPGITNYYNARLLSDKYLTKSRYGLVLSVTVAPRGLILLPGKVVAFDYPRYGWVGKKFRIESMSTSGDDCLVDLVVKEYDDSFYTASNIKRQKGTGVAPLPVTQEVNPPTTLAAVQLNDPNFTSLNIKLTWVNSSSASFGTTTEVYGYPIVRNITGGLTDTFITSEDQLLAVDDKVVFYDSGTGLSTGTVYYVVEVTGVNNFKVSSTKGGTALAITTGSYSVRMGRETLLTTVDYPIDTYTDVITGTPSVDRYYRIRHKSLETYSTFTSMVLGSASGSLAVHIGTDTQSIHLADDEDYIGWFGALKATDAPTKMKKDGTLQSRKFEQRDKKNNLLWSSDGGFTSLGKAKIAETNANSLPSLDEVILSVNNVTVAPSSTTMPSGTEVVDNIRLGAKSDIVIEVECTLEGSASSDSFTDIILGLYERSASSLAGLSSATWAQLGDTSGGGSKDMTFKKVSSIATITATGASSDNRFTTASAHNLSIGQLVEITAVPGGSAIALGTYYVRKRSSSTKFEICASPDLATSVTLDNGTYSIKLKNQFAVTQKASANWNGDNFVQSTYYTVEPTSAKFVIGTIKKDEAYYQYAVLGPNATPLTGLASTIKVTDMDGVPSLILAEGGNSSVNYTHPLGVYNNIRVFCDVSGAKNVAVSADMVVLYTDSGLPRTVVNLNPTPSNNLVLSSSGVGGLDTGTVAANTWYYIWVISNGLTDGVIASLSSTSPTMPTDYTFKRLVSACKTNSSSNVRPFFQQNNKVTLVHTATDPLPSIAGEQGSANVGGASPTWAAISWSGAPNYYLPTNSFSAIVSVSFSGGGTGDVAVMSNNNFLGVDQGANAPPLFTTNKVPNVGEVGLESSNIYYGSSNPNGLLRFLGYTLKL